MGKEEILAKIKEAVITYNKDGIIAIVEEGLKEGVDPVDLVQDSLTPAIQEIGDKFGKGEIPLPFLMLGAETMQLGLFHLLSKIPKGQYKPKATMVIGSVAGDIHDLGINIMTAVFEAAGIHMINLGRDVPAQKFIDAAEENNADIIGTSALLSGTMFQQKVVLGLIKKQGLRDKYIYMIGGGAMPSGAWCEEIGADGWSTDVMDALEKAKALLASKKGVEID
ncbi:MAG: dimethylamine corrinoid protein 3 [Candidatus Lokiarchaeota archaeon]|nr:dimethylamine corrinoid protein 3 [Candidatus Lokiarchaeota archaeon]